MNNVKINSRKPHLNGIRRTERGAFEPYQSSVADPGQEQTYLEVTLQVTVLYYPR